MGPAKHAKWDDRCGLGGPCRIARPDIGRGRDALRRGMSKKNVQRQYLTGLSESVPHLFVLRGLLCKFCLLPSVRARFKRGGSPKILAKLRDVPCQQYKDHKD